jgi:hypothetical protein
MQRNRASTAIAGLPMAVDARFRCIVRKDGID